MSAPASPFRFNEHEFKDRVNKALSRVRTILENTRHPNFPADVPHQYEDKFLLAEFLVNATVSSVLNVFASVGVSEKHLAQLQEWSRTRSVTLRLKAEEACKFLRKEEREVKSDTKYVSESTLFGKRESYTVTKVTEYFWQFDVRYELVVFQGNEPEKANVVLQQRHGTVELKVTNSDVAPKPATTVRDSRDVNLTWLLQQLDASHHAAFKIDRAVKSCHTPRRNEPVEGAVQFVAALHAWAQGVHSYFTSTLFPVQADHGLDVSAISDTSLFVPVQPLFETQQSERSKPGDVLPAAQYLAQFLAEQQRSIAEKFKELERVFPSNAKLVTVAEAKLSTMSLHLRQLCVALCSSVDYIEDMLFKQLVAAVGKELTPVDFNAYMRYHARKLFRAEYQPRPFCFAIRRPDHYPEGILSIEGQQHDGSLADPIQTTVAWAPATRPMRFALDAATEVKLGGDRFLHGYLGHQFSSGTGVSLLLTARARQFSSFVVLLGTILSADTFDPKYAVILQNKDDLRIPLILETIPSAKEFREAISSLSPEQQRFAKAYRSMQLESTLFAVCVIQIKPQMEKLLNLPADALTKEIQLTQDLMSLFIEYQVPSDLLSYDGDTNNSKQAKIARVKQLVGAMQKTIKENEKEALTEERERQKYRMAEADEDKESSEDEEQEEVQVLRNLSRRKSERPEAKDKEKEKEEESKDSNKKEASKDRKAKPMLAKKLDAAPSPKRPSPQPQQQQQQQQQQQAQSGKQAQQQPPVGGNSGSAQPAQPQQTPEGGDEQSLVSSAAAVVDYTKIPRELEEQFDELDSEGACRPTIIKPGSPWTKRFQKSLLAAPESKTMDTDEQGKERQRCFDLLDGLTKSGALAIDYASLHVVIASTHCFTKTLMNTVVQDNVNPIEKLERSALIVASTIHQTTAQELVRDEQVERIARFNPQLIEHVDSPASDAHQLFAAAGATSSVSVAKK